MINRISTLIIKQLQGEITPSEREELEQFSALSEANRKLVSNLTDHQTLLDQVKESYQWYNKADLAENQEARPGELVKIKWYRVANAAAVLIAIACFTWFYLIRPKPKAPLVVNEKPVVEYEKALLKKSNGSKLQLAKSDSNIAYSMNAVPQNSGADTLETEKKAYYKLRLPDGSLAWLNATSSLTFPARFSDTDRVVDLDGEAYFEVVRNTAKPFKVRVYGMEVGVVGTRFNVKAYKKDGIVRTTLFEGSVKLYRGKQTDILKVGDQAFLKGAGKLKITALDDSALKRALAWKENKFSWEQEDIEYIISDVAHWYGYNVVYQRSVSGITYTGTINRSYSMEDVLDIIAKNSGLQFSIDKDTIVVHR